MENICQLNTRRKEERREGGEGRNFKKKEERRQETCSNVNIRKIKNTK